MQLTTGDVPDPVREALAAAFLTRAREVLSRDRAWSAPEHWKAEVSSAIRGLVGGGHLDDVPAERTIARIPRLTVELVG